VGGKRSCLRKGTGLSRREAGSSQTLQVKSPGRKYPVKGEKKRGELLNRNSKGTIAVLKGKGSKKPTSNDPGRGTAIQTTNWGRGGGTEGPFFSVYMKDGSDKVMSGKRKNGDSEKRGEDGRGRRDATRRIPGEAFVHCRRYPTVISGTPDNT